MIRWTWVFLDRPADRFDAAFDFWSAVTGTRLSERRGEHGEFATLIPADGDAYLRAQAVGGPGGAHPDFDVDDLAAARRHAHALGAVTVADHDTWSQLRSPHGQSFCLTTDDGRRIPSPVAGPGGELSRLDQLSVDIAPGVYDREVTFWAALTGWELQPAAEPEFVRLLPPSGLPFRMLLQRLGEDRPGGAHPDIACTDIEAVASWHEKHGARRVSRGAHWIVMNDPTGGVYCLTPRDPRTGRLPE
ncbi:VOC family protein [Nocardia sp. alder85J]|uniref:VOC family protein n=1 Tax=Nocardia sp. alder85J TaxID=2862949 RepID=UPI001CD48584|nr:VOC family protein [Nocardia sp. alder85J]MCX4094862.1 VOC family protein [Nocardia sp. alder85J]